MAIGFDPETLETIGDEVPLIEGVFRFGSDRPTQVAISDSGTLAYMPGGMSRIFQGTLAWVDREGREEPIDEKPRLYSNVNISPDGTRVAFQITVDGNADIWIYDLAHKTLTQLTRHEADDGSPLWTPDGKQIIFCSEREGNLSIFSIAASGTEEAEQIAYIEDSYIWPFSLSNDGKTLSFGHWNLLDGYNIGIHSMDGAHAPKLLLQDEYIKSYPRISPDGRWLAYQTNKTGQDEVYIHSFPDVDSGRKKQVSIGGGRYPVWSPDGKELFYVSFSGKQMVVSVEADPELKIGEPQILFDRRPYPGLDMDPKSRRFLAIKRVESTEDGSAQGIPRKIIVVTNWFEELKDRVPVD